MFCAKLHSFFSSKEKNLGYGKVVLILSKEGKTLEKGTLAALWENKTSTKIWREKEIQNNKNCQVTQI